MGRRNRRKSRTGSGMSMTGAGDFRASSVSRQYSDGGSERATKSASAVAQEARTAGGALQTAEGREEGAVAMKVRRGSGGGRGERQGVSGVRRWWFVVSFVVGGRWLVDACVVRLHACVPVRVCMCVCPSKSYLILSYLKSFCCFGCAWRRSPAWRPLEVGGACPCPEAVIFFWGGGFLFLRAVQEGVL